MKPVDECLLCGDRRRGWVAGTYGEPGHDCQMCAACCQFSAYWQRCVARGTADAMRRQLLVTQARGAARQRRGPGRY
jgi:hypothetical protein